MIPGAKAKDHYSREELLACGRGEMFGPGNAQLPVPPMLMFDRITRITDNGGAHDKGQVIAELDIHPDLWFFGCHFINDPVMPGCLGLDAMWQLVGYFLGWSGAPGKGVGLGGLGCSQAAGAPGWAALAGLAALALRTRRRPAARAPTPR